jgi:hypothetical protein
MREDTLVFLRVYQRVLSSLPEDQAVFVVFGAGHRPHEIWKVFLDRAAAALWCATNSEPLDFSIEPFHVHREHRSEITLLRPGETGPVDPLVAAAFPKRPRLAPLPRDTEIA